MGERIERDYRNFHALVKRQVIPELDRVLVAAGPALASRQKFFLSFPDPVFTAAFGGALPKIMLRVEQLVAGDETHASADMVALLKRTVCRADASLSETPIILHTDVLGRLGSRSVGVSRAIEVEGPNAAAWIDAARIYCQHATTEDFTATIGQPFMFAMMTAFKEPVQQR